VQDLCATQIKETNMKHPFVVSAMVMMRVGRSLLLAGAGRRRRNHREAAVRHQPIVVAFVTAALIAAALVPAPAAAQPARSQWSVAKRIPAGEDIIITARDGRVCARMMVAGSDTDIVTLDLTRLADARAASVARQVVRDVPQSSNAPGRGFVSIDLIVREGIVRQGSTLVDLRPAFDRFKSEDVALIVRPGKPASRTAMLIAAACGIGTGVALGQTMRMDGNRSTTNVGATLSLSALFGGAATVFTYLGTHRSEKMLYRAGPSDAAATIDDGLWKRLQRALPDSLKPAGGRNE
jgi:hypothetical protein